MRVIPNFHCLVIRNFGAFLTLSPEFCFVVEDDHSVVGFVAAAANAKELQRQVRVAWIPEMQTKYAELFQSNSSEDANIPGPLKVKYSACVFFPHFTCALLSHYFIQDLAAKLRKLHTEDLPDALLT